MDRTRFLFTERPMDRVPLRDAKARLSELVDAAERGEPVTITRHGRAAAVLVAVEDADQMFADRRTLVDVLKEMPGDLPVGGETSVFKARRFG
jgi:prevent-host-death family protein